MLLVLVMLLNGPRVVSLLRLVIKQKPEAIFDYRFEDFEIVNYQVHPHIPAPVAV